MMRAFFDITFEDDRKVGQYDLDEEAWIVEALIDTGQRLFSVDLDRGQAVALADQMRNSLMVTVVAMINLQTGEAHVRASAALSTSGWITGRSERELIAEACR